MKIMSASLFSLVMLSSSSYAIGLSSETGKSFTGLDYELGKTSSGLYLQGDWFKNTKNGNYFGGGGLGYNFEFGSFILNVAAKTVYISPGNGSAGVTYPIGGGVTWKISDSFNLFAEGYNSNKAFNNSVRNYTEANSGISWKPIPLLTLKAGYRYAGIDGKKNKPSTTLIEGPYGSIGLSF